MKDVADQVAELVLNGFEADFGMNLHQIDRVLKGRNRVLLSQLDTRCIDKSIIIIIKIINNLACRW